MSDSSDVSAKAREALEGITSGPWIASKGGGSWGVYYAGNIVSGETRQIVATGVNSANGHFVAAAPELVAGLLAALETAEIKIREQEEAMDYLAGHDRAGLDHLDEAVEACTERDNAEAKIRAVQEVADEMETHAGVGTQGWFYLQKLRAALGGVS